MGILDFLIDKNNGNPKPDMEYIYRLDMTWKPDELQHYPITIGTIVNNVIQLDNRSYEFTIKDTGEVFRTNYAWALAENTPENIKKIKKYEDEYEKFKIHEKLINLLRDDIDTLSPKSSIKKQVNSTEQPDLPPDCL